MKLKNYRNILTFSLTILIFFQSYGEVKLPRLISDGMVLQRNSEIKLWGWASPGEKISLQFIDSTYNIKANKSGEWSIILKGLNAGGPYKMEIRAKNVIEISDIMIGDVWICSGQSNMELSMRRVSPKYQTEIANCENKFIRQFVVPQKYDFNKPHNNLGSGSWKSANPENIFNFSAVAYFFAKELYDKYKIPVGLINASLGGSPAEAWISEEGLKKFPVYLKEVEKFRDSTLIIKIENSDRARSQAWYTLLRMKDEGYKDPKNTWVNPALNTADWLTTKIPGYWSSGGPGPVNGVVWFRKEIQVPSSMAGQPAKLNLGRIVDADSVFVNGTCVGSVSYQYPPRRYEIPSGVLKEGKNNIVVRVISNIGIGGFVPDKPYELIAGGQIIDLKGEWQFRLGAKMEPLQGQTFIRWKPEGLYNAMINPLINYRIKGVIWYQGEGNASRSSEYTELFSSLIKDWRTKWNQGEFPFLFVQLPNFMDPKTEPGESDWALLREAQLKTLSVPNTGMAVAIDIGEYNDIHPLNKKDVGKRLALAAQKLAYKEEKIVYSGPNYRSFKIEGNRVTLTFDQIGSGLVAKGGGELKYFAISGADKKFVWANATIDKGKVIVWSDKVSNPVAVRYAWADDPEGSNLYNEEGLPASPFRTDDWK